ncbi:helix-turn-helix domain-containing protein [Enterobacter hormaechei]|uniref:helix-turn-helix domain-containing protein n=1 Tax=Enterobacter hormaechei TaxID=158836 RepID=UPI002A75B4B7|nr:helix-turn-helix domain-containing protein [Enterobacter hormaechei]MDY3570240.1 helix-turn-helix domain-containing protein [Enterobacter hormaechei]
MNKNMQHTESPETRNSLAARLDELMRLNHWSRTEMAKIAGVSPTSVTNWFKRETISKESASKLAKAAKISLTWLLTGAEEPGANISDDELMLIEIYRELPPVERRNMLAAFQMRLQKVRDYYTENVDPSTREK